MNTNEDASAGADSIAIVGLAGHFPGASSANELWHLLVSGKAATEWRSAEQLRAAGVTDADLADAHYVRASLLLPGMENFDAGFFGFSPRDAAVMDPQHRHFLMCAWEALEDAGHMPERFEGAVGVFAGCGMQSYLPQNLLTNPALVKSMGLFLLRHTGNDKDFLSSRLSYLLDLRGPSITVQTACSTSLVAVHLAAQSLLSGECDMALAGGVSIELPHGRGYHYAAGEILSPDGVCRAFDAQAAGTLFGSGVGVVVLRRLADALADGDQIYAVIRGSAVNNDGAQKAGYLAPSVEGQARAAVEALAVAGVPPQSVQYIEAHGTGTPVGDPIEVAALAQAYGGQHVRCGLGSIKTNIGHLDTAAGVAGLIKVALAFRHGVIPASLNFSQPNPRMDLARAGFEVLSQARSWPRSSVPRRAAVNALGVGGTNAHVVLEEAPAAAERASAFNSPSPMLSGRSPELAQSSQLLESAESSPWRVFTLSARTPAALQRLQGKWRAFLSAPPAQFNLADAAHTLRAGRRDFSQRLAVLARTPHELATALGAGSGSADAGAREKSAVTFSGRFEPGAHPPAVVMMFPGGGASYPGAGRNLLSQRAFAEAVEDCMARLGPDAPADLRAAMFGTAAETNSASAATLQHPRYGLPALFIVSYALARLWQSWGVKPAALIGHSAGDYAAACIAGVMRLEDALAIVSLRARLFEQAPPGGMLGVDLPASELQAQIDAAHLPLDIAVHNADDHCIASGALAPLAELQSQLDAAGVLNRRLRIDVAAHSRLLDAVLPEFAARMAHVPLSAPQIPMISNLTGTWATTAQLTDPAYWVQHLRQPVRFADGLRTVLALPHAALLEAGPGQGLLALAQQAQVRKPTTVDVSGTRHAAQDEQVKAKRAERALLLASTAKAASDADDTALMLGSAATLWTRGAELDWPALLPDPNARRISLPTYAFETERHWIEPGRSDAAPGKSAQPNVQPSVERLPDLKDWFLKPQWTVAAPLPADALAALAGQHCLLFGDEGRLTAELVLTLLNHSARVTLVHAGPVAALSRQIDGSFSLNPAEPLHYRQLLQALAAQGMPRYMLHLWALQAGRAHAYGAVEESLPGQNLCFDSLLYLAQALQAEDLDSPLHLTVVTAGSQALPGERSVQPIQALALGPCRVIPQELPWVHTRLVDLLPAELANSAAHFLPTRLLAECVSVESTPSARLSDDVNPNHDTRISLALADDMVALRAGERGLMQCVPLQAPAPLAGLRRNGVYLITGGLGTIALALADHLARTQQARLALLSRRSLPAPENWRGIVQAASAEDLAHADSEAALLQRLLAMQDAGAQLLLLSADVADADAMGRVLAHCRGRFGALHGVFHAAGVLDDAPIHAKTPASVQRVLSAKAGGAAVLDKLLPTGTLDVFAVFSSTSVYLGAPGQVDYVAANAYLDALAASRPEGLCIHWGIWGDAGMAKRAYAERKPQAPSQSHEAAANPHAFVTSAADSMATRASTTTTTETDETSTVGTLPSHPLLGHRDDSAEAARFFTRLDPRELWLLREHQVGGRPVLVGMAYVEMARAATQALHPGAPLELRAFSFAEAMAFDGDAPREVMTCLTPSSNQQAYSFEVFSRATPTAPWQSHARATVHVLDASEVSELATGAHPSQERWESGSPTTWQKGSPPTWQKGSPPQSQWLHFGPHWQCVQRMQLAPECSRAELALPADCQSDASVYEFHPALADMASTFALQLPQVPDTALYVPLSVKRLRIFAPLLSARNGQLLSRARLSHQDADRLVGLDLAMRSPDGALLASFEGFYLRGLPPQSPSQSLSQSLSLSRPASLIERMLAGGIRTEDAPAVFERIFASAERDLIVSSLPLPAVRQAMQPKQPKQPQPVRRPDSLAGASASDATPNQAGVASQHSAVSDRRPTDEVHEGIAAAWRELLGVDALSKDDDFFALGGHSLAAVRLFARIRKRFGVDLPLATLFETPTLGALVERVRAEYAPAVPEANTSAAVEAPQPTHAAVGDVPQVLAQPHLQPAFTSQAQTRPTSQGAATQVPNKPDWSPLVRINAGVAGIKPIFCVHGAAGNVLNFKVIADRLGHKQPFYGLQAQGVDGRLPPLPSIEAMASRYVAAIREVDPVGPYRLAGYSGGGVIAYEMAQQLRRAGAALELLAMLDTLAPAAASARLSPLRKLWLMRRWSLGFTLGWPERRRVRRTEQLNHVLALQALARGEPLTPELASARLFSHFVAAQSQYQLQPYAGDLLLLRAEQGYTPYLNAGPQLGWQHHVQGRIEVVEIAGSHVSMLTEPGLTQLARALCEHMADAETDRDPMSGPPGSSSEHDGQSLPAGLMPGLLGTVMQRDLR